MDSSDASMKPKALAIVGSALLICTAIAIHFSSGTDEEHVHPVTTPTVVSASRSSVPTMVHQVADATMQPVAPQHDSTVRSTPSPTQPAAQQTVAAVPASQHISPGNVTCVQRWRNCASRWPTFVEKPKDANQRHFTFRDNACGFGKSGLRERANRILRTHELQFHGDSTLRELVKVLIKFVGISGNLEKRDSNKNQRTARYFDEQIEGIGGRVRLTFRFDYEPLHVNELFDTRPETFNGVPRIDVVCMGVHMGDHDIVDLKTDYSDAVAKIPDVIHTEFKQYLERVNADDSVTAVLFFQQELECDQMAKAALPQFQRRAPFCSKVSAFVEEYNRVLNAFLDTNPMLARKVVVLGQFNCGALKPRGTSCSKDGIHLHTRWLRLATEAFIDVMSGLGQCSSLQ